MRYGTIATGRRPPTGVPRSLSDGAEPVQNRVVHAPRSEPQKVNRRQGSRSWPWIRASRSARNNTIAPATLCCRPMGRPRSTPPQVGRLEATREYRCNIRTDTSEIVLDPTQSSQARRSSVCIISHSRSCAARGRNPSQQVESNDGMLLGDCRYHRRSSVHRRHDERRQARVYGLRACLGDASGV
jgi:hypothetical protein